MEARAGAKLGRTAQQRLRWMDYYRRWRNAARTCRYFGISQQTFYRWKRRWDPHDLRQLEARSHRPHQARQATWAADLVERVLQLRQQYPRWGKDKLVVLQRRERRAASISMAGRILSYLKKHGRLHEPVRRGVPCAARRGVRRRRWVERKPKYWPIQHPGDIVQIDSKQVRPTRGVLWHHFSAGDMASRWDVAQAYPRATALAATHFLDHLLERMSFPVRALQVDGGSEFAADFELACQIRHIRPFVLPRCSPKLNGCVEHAHRTHHEEFYQITPEADTSFTQLNQQLRRWEHTYNTIRSHQALGYLTPQQFLLSRPKEAMCH